MSNFIFWSDVVLAVLYGVNLALSLINKNWSAVCGWSCALILSLGIITRR